MMLHLPLRQSVVLLQRSTTGIRPLGCFRCLFTGKGGSTSSTDGVNKDDSSEQPIEWLYKRTPNNMLKPRTILGLACFHSLYWSWYCLDFMPAVNQSPLEHLHIDPVVGYVGMFFSIFVNLGALLYPWSLVSGMGLRGKELCVFTHTMITMEEAKEGVVYEIGDVSMDPSAKETKKIVETLQGDIGSYRGFIALKANRRRLPYLLQIEDSNEVVDPWLFLQVLVNPNLANKEIERSSGVVDGKPKGKDNRTKGARGKKRGR